MIRGIFGSARLPSGLVAVLAGAVLPLSFAPFGWFFLAPLSLAILFRCWAAPPREAAWCGFWYGTGAFLAGTWWLYISVRLVGGTPLPVAVVLLGGLVAIMGAWIALAGWLVARFHYASLFLTACVLSPASYVLTEWLRGWMLSGFPWLSVGYGQIDGPLAAWAPVGGVYAVSLVTAMLAGIVLALVTGTARDRALAAIALAVVALSTWSLSGRDWTVPEGKALRVALVQGAIPQLLKWEPGEQRATLELYASLTVALREIDLVVWPEAAIPVPDDLVPEYLSDLARLAESRNWQLLVGILTHEPQSDEYRNSLLALGRERGVYHKRHLVPFGEYFPVPDMVRSWMRLMNLPYSDIAPGEPQQPLLRAHGVGLAPTICYEDAFGAEQLGFLPAAGLLVNVSNDAWFGDTIAPHQHLQMARMRSRETGRYLVRSTNTGVTAIIDHRGNVRATIPSFEPEVLTGIAQPYSGATPYVRAGNYPVVLTCLLIFVLATAAQLAQGRHRAG